WGRKDDAASGRPRASAASSLACSPHAGAQEPTASIGAAGSAAAAAIASTAEAAAVPRARASTAGARRTVAALAVSGDAAVGNRAGRAVPIADQRRAGFEAEGAHVERQPHGVIDQIGHGSLAQAERVELLRVADGVALIGKVPG